MHVVFVLFHFHLSLVVCVCVCVYGSECATAVPVRSCLHLSACMYGWVGGWGGWCGGWLRTWVGGWVGGWVGQVSGWPVGGRTGGARVCVDVGLEKVWVCGWVCRCLRMCVRAYIRVSQCLPMIFCRQTCSLHHIILCFTISYCIVFVILHYPILAYTILFFSVVLYRKVMLFDSTTCSILLCSVFPFYIVIHTYILTYIYTYVHAYFGKALRCLCKIYVLYLFVLLSHPCSHAVRRSSSQAHLQRLEPWLAALGRSPPQRIPGILEGSSFKVTLTRRAR